MEHGVYNEDATDAPLQDCKPHELDIYFGEKQLRHFGFGRILEGSNGARAHTRVLK